MSAVSERGKARGDRIGRLRKRIAAIAEDDAKQDIQDPIIPILKGILDLLEDEL